MRTVTTLEQLRARTVTDERTGCWLWQGATYGGTGYAALTVAGRNWSGHRLAWTLAHGEIPPGLNVCHTCDTRTCVNPAHLFLAQRGVNAWDAARKGRLARKLTADDVADIRNRYRPGTRARNRTGTSSAELAQLHGVGRTMIQRIYSRGAWTWCA